ncbi:MAG: nitroreductase [Chloroflexi bacterium]|nr:nitroreductase [Chloroflexota bacterium]
MDIISAIHSRHSQGKVRPDPLPRELIEKLLQAAVQAPNHFRVRPWRFVVLTGAGRERFGDSLAAAFKAKFPDAPAEAIEKERQKALRAPLVIVVAVDQPSEPKINETENIAAAAAACQNLLLAATGLGLGSIWRTGDNARDPEIKKFLGFSPEQHLLGFLYIGYLDGPPTVFPERPTFDDRTVWME